jgi:hypothetical protein
LYERHAERRTVSREERAGYAEALRRFLQQSG